MSRRPVHRIDPVRVNQDDQSDHITIQHRADIRIAERRSVCDRLARLWPANLFATLPTLDDRLRKAHAPAHSSLLIVAAPIADKLHGAVADTLRPRPSHEEL